MFDLEVNRTRKREPKTNLFVLENGKKRRLVSNDFGAGLDEKPGQRVKGLGAPPPTQFIVIPDLLLTEDQVVAYAAQEKKTLEWKLAVAKNLLRVAADRLVDATLRLVDWTGERVAELIILARSKIRERRNQSFQPLWGEEETDVVRGRASSGVF